jgi:hypothetical protein
MEYSERQESTHYAQDTELVWLMEWILTMAFTAILKVSSDTFRCMLESCTILSQFT